jgi:tRNA threonylcarbamoyladenosine biosynthesis protein TsaE
MLAQGALIVEWPERLGDLIPEENLWIDLEHVSVEQRRLSFVSRGARYDELSNEIRRSIAGVK